LILLVLVLVLLAVVGLLVVVGGSLQLRQLWVHIAGR
jgi:hypothetical protein